MEFRIQRDEFFLDSGLKRWVDMKTIYICIFIIIALCNGACSDDNRDSGRHVWKEQTDALKQAEQVEDQILKQAELQRKSIEQQTRQ